MKQIITTELVKATMRFLGQVGMKHMIEVQDDLISIHLREGMQIRNFMRSTPYCKDWTHEHDFDDNWIPLIRRCLKYNEFEL